MMKVAVTHENGQIFGHFGRTETFKVYKIENGQIVSSQVVGTDGQGHGALAIILNDMQIDALICGGIGGGAQHALAQLGIKLYGGCYGSCDDAVQALIEGRLEYNPNVQCGHHHAEHGEDGHTCGNHGCGSGHCH
jgi:predicted Fe-Mo cluster-binding NifX family protein